MQGRCADGLLPVEGQEPNVLADGKIRQTGRNWQKYYLCPDTPTRGSPHRPTLLSTQPDLTNPVLAQNIPGFLPGLPGGLLFFRCHGRFLFIFPVTSAFFRHIGSPDN